MKDVTLFFTPEVHAEFTRVGKELAVAYKMQNMSDTIYEAMRRSASAPR